MRILNLNSWWPTIPLSRETADERFVRLVKELKHLKPEVVTLQESDPKLLGWLIENGYEVAIGQMSTSDSRAIPLEASDCEATKEHLSLAIASRVGLSKAKKQLYYSGGFWPKALEDKLAEEWTEIGGAVDGSNLNPTLLTAEVDGISIGVTHGPWDITSKPRDRSDQSGKTSDHQRQGIIELCRVIKESETPIDIIAGDSNTHTTYPDSMFEEFRRNLNYNLALPPIAEGTLDQKYFRHKEGWVKILSPDNVAYSSAKLSLVATKQIVGVSDHQAQLVDFKKVVQ